MRDLLFNILLPRTDVGVAIQVVLVLGVFAFALRRTWGDRDLRRLVAGGGVFVLGLMVMRGAH